MDRNEQYRAIVKRLLQEVADITPSEENIITEFVSDERLGHYQVGQVGWENKRRVDDRSSPDAPVKVGACSLV